MVYAVKIEYDFTSKLKYILGGCNMTNDEIKEKYDTVGSLLEEAVNKAESVKLVGEEENAELAAINSTLKEINNEFKEEINKLEASSEWDKFCIAFFGETNAGKSTIIESLRIIYDEEQRRLEKEDQEKEYEIALTDYCEKYKDLLNILRETNTLLVSKKEPSKLILALKNIGLIVLGVVIGFVVAYLGF